MSDSNVVNRSEPRLSFSKQATTKRELAAEKPPTKPRFGAKSEFVRSLESTIPAAEVVALAEKRGLKLTTALVYNIRSASNAGARNGQGGSAIRVNGRPQRIEENVEAQLRVAIAQVGLARALQILAEVEATFTGQ
jgi:hypothetical protein